jgi:hypothetical protein
MVAALRSQPVPVDGGVWRLQLAIRWLDDRRRWRAGGWSVECVSVESLRDRLLSDSTRRIDKEVGLRAIQRLYAHDKEVDVIDGAPKVSLKCPVSP